ncbi:putative N2 N2 dimethylguanosine tRNA methyltransferase [Trypanosoma vivax]|nr:N(2) N(2)-dimethylguanosine tRNA methyltransferase [Trypanosoma vivax]KAH8611911.1 putative N2 N2 dimethylguanosine tRNA methyltransferase [Trypanosoma vivax]
MSKAPSTVALRSGLFGLEGLDKEGPHGFVKVTEGTAALFFPPPAPRRTHSTQSSENKGKATIADPTNSNANGGPDANNSHAELPEEHHNVSAADDAQSVFYNPAQVVNRDLSVCAIACFARLRRQEPHSKGGTRSGITILEALSASGLRAIRYYKEISGVRFIIANDIDPDAVESIKRNCELNGVPCAEPTLEENFDSSSISYNEKTGDIERGGAVIVNLDDANDLMFRLASNPSVHHGRRLCSVCVTGGGTEKVKGAPGSATPLLQQELVDVVDLDPYGSVSPFLDGAIRCIKEGGLLIATSTDSAILCGNYPDTCHAKYNTVPVKSAACHEMAVRILLGAIERVANKHRKYIVPLLSLHVDFYVRCFVRVYTQPAEVKLSPCKLGYFVQCSNCPAFWVRPIAAASRRIKKRTRKQVVEGTKDLSVCDSREIDIGASNSDDKNQADSLGRECFPPVPSWQDNPKVVSCRLQQLPSALLDKRCCCSVCGAPVALSGPVYAAPTHSKEFLVALLDEIEKRSAQKQITAAARISGLVRVAIEELPDTPLFFQLPDVASFVHVRCPPTPLFVGALGRMGYRCSQVHCSPSGIKTDCPPDVLVSVMMQWKENENAKSGAGSVQKSKLYPNEAGELADGGNGIVERSTGKNGCEGLRGPLVAPLAGVDFAYDRRFDFRSTATGVAKFIPNAPYWGPKRRHQGALRSEEEI